MSRRVVVTGMGMISPLGNDLATSWEGITAGRSGIGPITSFDASQFSTRIAGEIRGFDVASFGIPAKDAKKMDPFIHYGLAASFMALDDSGLEINEANAERIGALIGAGAGALVSQSALPPSAGAPDGVLQASAVCAALSVAGVVSHGLD